MNMMNNRLTRAWIAGLALVCACNRAPSSAASDAMQVIERWAKAFGDSNVDAIVALYAPDASFFGTGSPSLVSTPEQIRSYFETGLNRDKPRGAELLDHAVQVVSDDVVIVTGKDRVSGTKNGNVYQVEGRVTFVLRKQASTWQIVHFHRSALPPS
jgi:uncharacterized protein (TIGR02246 family)